MKVIYDVVGYFLIGIFVIVICVYNFYILVVCYNGYINVVEVWIFIVFRLCEINILGIVLFCFGESEDVFYFCCIFVFVFSVCVLFGGIGVLERVGGDVVIYICVY